MSANRGTGQGSTAASAANAAQNGAAGARGADGQSAGTRGLGDATGNRGSTASGNKAADSATAAGAGTGNSRSRPVDRVDDPNTGNGTLSFFDYLRHWGNIESGEKYKSAMGAINPQQRRPDYSDPVPLAPGVPGDNPDDIGDGATTARGDGELTVQESQGNHSDTVTEAEAEGNLYLSWVWWLIIPVGISLLGFIALVINRRKNMK